MKLRSLILKTLTTSAFILMFSVVAFGQEEEAVAAECAEAAAEYAPAAAVAAAFLIVPSAIVSLRRRISKK